MVVFELGAVKLTYEDGQVYIALPDAEAGKLPPGEFGKLYQTLAKYLPSSSTDYKTVQEGSPAQRLYRDLINIFTDTLADVINKDLQHYDEITTGTLKFLVKDEWSKAYLKSIREISKYLDRYIEEHEGEIDDPQKFKSDVIQALSRAIYGYEDQLVKEDIKKVKEKA